MKLADMFVSPGPVDGVRNYVAECLAKDPSGDVVAQALGELQGYARHLNGRGAQITASQLQLVCAIAQVYMADRNHAMQSVIADSFNKLVKAAGLETTVFALLDNLKDADNDAEENQLRRDLLKTLDDYRARLDT